MTTSTQIKTGKSITMIQLIISVVVVLTGAIGLYVKSEVDKAKLEDRVQRLEEKLTEQVQKRDASIAVSKAARDAQYKDLDERVDKNTSDITIINTQLPFLQRKK